MKQTPLSSPGLTGRPSIPETFEIDREAAAYSIARSSRAMTVLIVAAALPSPSFFLGRRRDRHAVEPRSSRHCEFGTGLGPTLMDETNTAVIARLDRATQYSRDV